MCSIPRELATEMVLGLGNQESPLSKRELGISYICIHVYIFYIYRTLNAAIKFFLSILTLSQELNITIYIK